MMEIADVFCKNVNIHIILRNISKKKEDEIE